MQLDRNEGHNSRELRCWPICWRSKKSARDAGPRGAPREMRLAPGVGQMIFLVRRAFETVLLPDLADSDAVRAYGWRQGRDCPVWSDYLR